MSDSELARLLRDLPAPDQSAQDAVNDRASNVLRPQGAFMALDHVAAWLAGWQSTPRPAVHRPHAVIFAADHGVAADGVSAYPAEVTAAMVAALDDGVATAAVLAKQSGVEIQAVDVGVGAPTANLRTNPAMTAEQFDAAVKMGAATVNDLDTDLLVLGEMGIGNTTAAAAVAAALAGDPAGQWVGPGTGVADEALANKVDVVDQALARVRAIAEPVPPLEALRHLGGFEMAAIAGAVLAARHRGVPVVLDGFIVTAAVAPLHAVAANALDHCIAGHCSAEPGHQRLLDRLGLDPLISLDLRLGEASGALLAVPLIKMAAAAVVDVATFQEFGLA